MKIEKIFEQIEKLYDSAIEDEKSLNKKELIKIEIEKKLKKTKNELSLCTNEKECLKLKKKQNVAVLQSKRWNEILGKMILEGKEKGLSEDFVLKIFKAIHQESINNQNKVINS